MGRAERTLAGGGAGSGDLIKKLLPILAPIVLAYIGKQLSGDVSLAYAPAGFIYTLDVPLSALKPPA